MSEYNPYTAQCEQIDAELEVHRAGKIEIERNLDWHRRFNADEVFGAARKAEREIRMRENELELARKEWCRLAELESKLVPQAKIGFNPMRVFDAQRRSKAAELRECRRTAKVLAGQIQEQESLLKDVSAALAKQKDELNRYRELDTLQEQSRLISIERDILRLKERLEHLRQLSEKVDIALRPQLTELGRWQAEADAIQLVIDRAGKYEERLASARTGRDRALIHQECQSRLGDDKPRRLIARKLRELEMVHRTLAKLEDRIRQTAARAARVVELVILDGNNLCYRDGTFIGLRKARPLAESLARSFRVIIVFDASARRLLGMLDAEIAAQFSSAVQVHVVATKQKADETILDAAFAATSVVISNDRFREFFDKAVVREERVLRHEQVDGSVSCHDLGVSVRLDLTDNSAVV